MQESTPRPDEEVRRIRDSHPVGGAVYEAACYVLEQRRLPYEVAGPVHGLMTELDHRINRALAAASR